MPDGGDSLSPVLRGLAYAQDIMRTEREARRQREHQQSLQAQAEAARLNLQGLVGRQQAGLQRMGDEALMRRLETEIEALGPLRSAQAQLYGAQAEALPTEIAHRTFSDLVSRGYSPQGPVDVQRRLPTLDAPETLSPAEAARLEAEVQRYRTTHQILQQQREALEFIAENSGERVEDLITQMQENPGDFKRKAARWWERIPGVGNTGPTSYENLFGEDPYARIQALQGRASEAREALGALGLVADPGAFGTTERAILPPDQRFYGPLGRSYGAQTLFQLQPEATRERVDILGRQRSVESVRDDLAETIGPLSETVREFTPAYRRMITANQPTRMDTANRPTLMQSLEQSMGERDFSPALSGTSSGGMSQSLANYRWGEKTEEAIGILVRYGMDRASAIEALRTDPRLENLFRPRRNQERINP